MKTSANPSPVRSHFHIGAFLQSQIELTYNWDPQEYVKGDAYAQIAISTTVSVYQQGRC